MQMEGFRGGQVKARIPAPATLNLEKSDEPMFRLAEAD